MPMSQTKKFQNWRLYQTDLTTNKSQLKSLPFGGESQQEVYECSTTKLIVIMQVNLSAI